MEFELQKLGSGFETKQSIWCHPKSIRRKSHIINLVNSHCFSFSFFFLFQNKEQTNLVRENVTWIEEIFSK